MLSYLVRRLLYSIPILIGVSLLTFVLFYRSSTPEQIARRNLSAKNPSHEQILQWEKQHGYDKPLPEQFAKHMRELMLLQFGKSDSLGGEDIWTRIKVAGPVSFQIASLVFFSGLIAAICFALAVAYFRGTYIDYAGTFLCVLLMSVVYVVYIIAGQFILGKVLKYYPLAGYRFGWDSFRFAILPTIVGLISGLGASVRLYRTFLLEEMNLDYIRTARAKGVSERRILFQHVLKNASIPILTNVVQVIPALFLGSLLLESFFSIPGLGGWTADAILNKDFAVVRAMVFLGTLVTIIGYTLTDISYALVDPRVRLEGGKLGAFEISVIVLAPIAGLLYLVRDWPIVRGTGALIAGLFGALDHLWNAGIAGPIGGFWSGHVAGPLGWFWSHYSTPIGNLIPFVIVVVLVTAVVRSGREPLWAEAYRRLRSNPIAMGSLTIICLYGLVAMLDSVSWQDSRTARPETALDRIFKRVSEERTYSAPEAAISFGEPHPQPLKGRHIMGTDGNGQDVLVQTLKGCRTAIIIGGLTTLIVTPVALFMGMIAGYFGKRIDDAVQYLYTVVSSIPDILLLISLLLVFGRSLYMICIALSFTSWVGLCRLIRGETLKHRDREYVRAARALGVGPFRIMSRHILPNLLPTVIISATLGFSGLVLSETILTYLGIGVEAGIGSWGYMIDAARMELARDPIIWWNLAGATTALFLLVLAFNVFGDTLRDAIDPRLRT
ncbi:MAG TPA: ABC transporter permease subunit [Chthonomonadaceae bacterium]|nr:ABC transporter permease subunit [Chthonomonadaceae bacterium]